MIYIRISIINIKLMLYLYTGNLYFKLDIYYKNLKQINFINVIYSLYSLNKTPKIEIFPNANSADDISIKHEFLIDFLTKGKEHINVDDSIYEEFTQAILNTYKNT